MSIPGIITMIIVLGIVWGGLSFFIVKAFRNEKRKKLNGEN
jgi:hypothetical protein